MSFFDELSPEMDAYLEGHASAEPDLLAELAQKSFSETSQGHMISGHQQGRLLSILTALHQPKKVLEIGTFTGYASICIGQALSADAKLISLDKNTTTTEIAKEYIAKAGLEDKIDVIITDAKEYLQETNLVFDMVYIDADKENYPLYYEMALEKTRAGGLILIDNTLWYSKVLEENPKKKNTQAIQLLNKTISQDSRVEAVILPLRDGITLIRKK